MNVMQEIQRKLNMKAVGAFSLRIEGKTAQLHFGNETIRGLDFFVWLSAPDSSLVLTTRSGSDDPITLYFDRYGEGYDSIRFALMQGAKLVMDSDSSDVFGFFSVQTPPGHPQPLSLICLIDHTDEGEKCSASLGDRSPDLAHFSACLKFLMATILSRLSGDMEQQYEQDIFDL